MSETLTKIKSQGYWLVRIRPTQFEPTRISSLGKNKEIVQEFQVRLRGWYYPHIDSHGIKSALDYVTSEVDWEAYIEIWRMYQSGQFIHYFACVEDWLGDERTLLGNSTQYANIRAGTVLDFVLATYRLTEIYLFAHRLVKGGVLGPRAKIHIELCNSRGRRLFSLDKRRHLGTDYVCDLESIPRTVVLAAEQLVDWKSLAIEHTIWLFERFNWHFPGISETLEKDQQDLLSHAGSLT